MVVNRFRERRFHNNILLVLSCAKSKIQTSDGNGLSDDGMKGRGEVVYLKGVLNVLFLSVSNDDLCHRRNQEQDVCLNSQHVKGRSGISQVRFIV